MGLIPSNTTIALGLSLLTAPQLPIAALNVDAGVDLAVAKMTEGARPMARPWEDRIVANQNLNSVYLGNNAFITARHCGVPPEARDVKHVRNSSGGKVDLTLYRLNSTPKVSSEISISASPPPNQSVLIVAGRDRGSAANVKFGSSQIHRSLALDISYRSETPLIPISSETLKQSRGAARVEVGDSGGGAFYFNTKTGSWELTGILSLMSYQGVSANGSPRAAIVDLSSPAIRSSVLSYIAGGKGINNGDILHYGVLGSSVATFLLGFGALGFGIHKIYAEKQRQEALSRF